MISDTLFDAVHDITRYLNDTATRNSYRGKMRKRIQKCVREMDAIRKELDTPPNQPMPKLLARGHSLQ